MSVEKHAEEFNIMGAMITLIVSAFGFVAALFWRDAIRSAIDELIPTGQGLVYQFIVAIGVTIGAVIIIFILVKYVAKFSLKEKVKKVRSKIKRKKTETKKTKK